MEHFLYNKQYINTTIDMQQYDTLFEASVQPRNHGAQPDNLQCKKFAYFA
jgi:hypothetical protein